MLDPATTNRLESSFFDLFLDSIVHVWIVLLKPLVLLCLRDRKTMFWVSVHEITLIGPRSCHLPLGFGPRPQPTSIDMAMANPVDKCLLVGIIDLCRVDVLSNILFSDLSAFDYTVLTAIASDEAVHNSVANLQGLVSLPGVRRKFSRSITNYPEINPELPSLQIHSNYFSFVKGVVFIWIWWLY